MLLSNRDIFLKIVSFYKEFHTGKENSVKKRMIENFSFSLSVDGFLDGATKDGLCVVRGILKINEDRFF